MPQNKQTRSGSSTYSQLMLTRVKRRCDGKNFFLRKKLDPGISKEIKMDFKPLNIND